MAVSTGQKSPNLLNALPLYQKRSKKPLECINKTFTGWKNVFIFTFILFQPNDGKTGG